MAPPARKRIAFAHFRSERVDQVNILRSFSNGLVPFETTRK